MAKTVLWGLSIVYFGRIVTRVFLSVVSPGFAASQTYSYKDDSGAPNFITELDSILDKYRNRVVPLDSDPADSLE